MKLGISGSACFFLHMILSIHSQKEYLEELPSPQFLVLDQQLSLLISNLSKDQLPNCYDSDDNPATFWKHRDKVGHESFIRQLVTGGSLIIQVFYGVSTF